MANKYFRQWWTTTPSKKRHARPFHFLAPILRLETSPPQPFQNGIQPAQIPVDRQKPWWAPTTPHYKTNVTHHPLAPHLSSDLHISAFQREWVLSSVSKSKSPVMSSSSAVETGKRPPSPSDTGRTIRETTQFKTLPTGLRTGLWLQSYRLQRSIATVSMKMDISVNTHALKTRRGRSKENERKRAGTWIRRPLKGRNRSRRWNNQNRSRNNYSWETVSWNAEKLLTTRLHFKKLRQPIRQ